MSTYTNTDNHPGIIKTSRIVKAKNKMELHKQFKVPLAGLMPDDIPVATEVSTAPSKIKEKSKKKGKPFEVVEEIESDSDSEDEKQEDG